MSAKTVKGEEEIMTDSVVGEFFIAWISYNAKIIHMFKKKKQLRNSAKQNLGPLGFGTDTVRRQRKQVSARAEWFVRLGTELTNIT